MRILHISPLYPPHVGGLESHAEQFNDHLIAHHSAGKTPGVIQITVFTPRLPATAPTSEAINDRLSIIRFPAWQIIPNYPLPKFWQPKFWQLWRHVNQQKFDVVISRTRFFYTCLVAARYAHRHKIPYLHIEHGSDYVSLNNPITQQLAKLYDHTLGRYVLRRTDKLVANSQASANFAKRLSGKTAQVIYRGVDTKLINETPADTHIKQQHPDKLIITYAGRLIDGKGVDDLIKAFAYCFCNSNKRPSPLIGRRAGDEGEKETAEPKKTLTPNPSPYAGRGEAHLLIIGSGPQAQNLKHLAKQLNLDADISFLGQKSFTETIGLIKSSDIFVNPSHTEGLPSSVIEAALCKTAVIATNVGGTPEIVTNNKSALLIPSHHPKALAQALAQLADHPHERQALSHQAYQDVINKFTWPRATSAYNKLLQTFTKNLKDPGP